MTPTEYRKQVKSIGRKTVLQDWKEIISVDNQDVLEKQVPSDVYPRSRPDITATAPTKTMWRTLARFPPPRRGVTIPPAIMMNILKNGMFSTSLTVCLLLSFIQHAVQIQGLVIVVESLNQ